MESTMPKTIILNKDTDRFFISINKIGGHSFLMLGVYDQNKVSHLLCRVGKMFDIDPTTEEQNCFTANKRLFKTVFSSSKGKIQDEGTSRKKKGEDPISYQAYDINYRQYLEFIQLLEGLQTKKNQFKCYKPVEEDGNQVFLELTSDLIFNPRENMGDFKSDTSELRIRNTCRHTAIKLIEEVLHASISPLISSVFFRDLPYKTKLDYGKPSSDIPFYVLPVAPTAYQQLSEEKRKVLTKLYSRMEHLLLIKTHTKETEKKFNSLKDLYMNITGPQEELTLGELLISIQTWKEENKLNLNVLRVTYFWDSFFVRESATTKLITEIEEDLQQANDVLN